MNQINRGAVPPDSEWVRLQKAAHSRGVSARTVVTIVSAMGVVCVAGNVVYRMRDVLLLLAVAGFIALVLNPLVVAFVKIWS